MHNTDTSGFNLMPTGSANSRASTPQVSTKDKIYAVTALIALALCSYFLGVVVGPMLDSGSISSTSTSASTNSASSSKTPSIKFYNEYTINNTYSSMYYWENIVEPYKITWFEVENAVESSDYNYIWYLDGWHIAEGSKINFTFAGPTGSSQEVRVDVVSTSSNKVLYTSSTNVIVKYVRREIRNLLEQDRIAFLMAISIIYRVPTQTGKALYGANYRSRDFFTRIHLYYGGTVDCDHWHQVSVFL